MRMVKPELLPHAGKFRRVVENGRCASLESDTERLNLKAEEHRHSLRKFSDSFKALDS